MAAVIDGDTVRLDGKRATTIRLIGIDTPETVSPSVPDECFGAQASAAAHHLLDGKKVGVEPDRSQGRRDRYGRTLAYLMLPDGRDFGATMIRRGLVIEYTYDSAYDHQARYEALEQKAKAAHRGLWRSCGGADVPLDQPTRDQVRPPTGGSSSCASGYRPCIPPYPPDLDCEDVDGPIRVTGLDPHGLDADGDGDACTM